MRQGFDLHRLQEGQYHRHRYRTDASTKASRSPILSRRSPRPRKGTSKPQAAEVDQGRLMSTSRAMTRKDVVITSELLSLRFDGGSSGHGIKSSCMFFCVRFLGLPSNDSHRSSTNVTRRSCAASIRDGWLNSLQWKIASLINGHCLTFEGKIGKGFKPYL